MATEFICSIRLSGGDYSTLASWHTAVVASVDFTAAATKVFSGTVTGILSDGAAVTLYRGGASQGVTGTAKHDTATQILVISISNPSFGFQSGDEWRVDASNLFAISNAGDSAIPVAEGYNDWASGLPEQITEIGGGCTLSATNYLVVRAASTDGTQGQSKHDGTGLVGWKIRATGSAHWPMVGITGDFVRLQDFIIDATGYTGTGDVTVLRVTGSAAGTSGDIRIERMVVIGLATLTGSYQYGISIQPDATRTNPVTVKLSNNLVYNCLSASTSTGIRIRDSGTTRRMTTYCYNNTVVDCQTYGFWVYEPGTITVYNCLGAHTSGTSHYDFYAYLVGGTDSLTSGYCCATDTTLSGSPWSAGTGHRVSQTPGFVDRPNDNYHLTATDGACINFGTDLSADPNYPITPPAQDIDSNTRSGIWDIGADEYYGVWSLTYTEAGSGADAYTEWTARFNEYDDAGSGADGYTVARTLPAPGAIYTNESWDTAQAGDTNPSGITDQSPVFSALVYKRDYDITHVRVQVATDVGFTDLVWDSDFLELVTPISASGTRTPDIEYGESGMV